MRPTTRRTLRSSRCLAGALIAAGIACTSSAPPAMAQPRPGNPAPELTPPVPAPPKTEGTSRLISMFEAILLAGLIVGVNLIPSKRGHQD